MWSKDTDRGHVDHVTFSNMTSAAPARSKDAPAELVGFDADHRMDDTLFDHVTIGGRAMTPQDIRRNEFAGDASSKPYISP